MPLSFGAADGHACQRAEVGPNLQRGVVAVNDAEVSILQCHLHGCEEIGKHLAFMHSGAKTESGNVPALLGSQESFFARRSMSARTSGDISVLAFR
eukprot:1357018-Amphidinium_carterae.1